MNAISKLVESQENMTASLLSMKYFEAMRDGDYREASQLAASVFLVTVSLDLLTSSGGDTSPEKVIAAAEERFNAEKALLREVEREAREVKRENAN